MNFTKLAYLDLEIAYHRKVKVNLSEKFKIQCNVDHIENQYKHIPHTSDSQKNFIVDLIINLGQHIEENLSLLNQKFEISSINTLRRNLDYIKELISTFTTQVSKFPNKKELIELINLIDTKTPKPIEIEIKKLITELNTEKYKTEINLEHLEANIINLNKTLTTIPKTKQSP